MIQFGYELIDYFENPTIIRYSIFSSDPNIINFVSKAKGKERKYHGYTKNIVLIFLHTLNH